jgi:hypothetical protein
MVPYHDHAHDDDRAKHGGDGNEQSWVGPLSIPF